MSAVPVMLWIKSARQPLLGDSMSVQTLRSRRTGRVIATKPGAVLVLYWI